jgi:GNAT superfamily N-acetyltransferase
MQIAIATADDWQAWRALRLAALLDAPHAFGSRYEEWVQADATRWRKRLSHGRNWMASLDAPCGMVSAMPAPQVVNLIGLWVAPTTRRRGLADALVAVVIQWARDTGVTRVELEVKRGNHDALRAYARRGFQLTRGDEQQDVMALSL